MKWIKRGMARWTALDAINQWATWVERWARHQTNRNRFQVAGENFGAGLIVSTGAVKRRLENMRGSVERFGAERHLETAISAVDQLCLQLSQERSTPDRPHP